MTSTARWPTRSQGARLVAPDRPEFMARSATRMRASGLPGIPSNILAARLATSSSGIVQKRRRPPAACQVYEFTEYGAGLEEALYALARGVLARSGRRPRRTTSTPTGANALPAVFNRDEARATRRLHVQGRRRRLHGADHRRDAGASLGEAPDADLVVETDAETFFLLAGGELEPPPPCPAE